MCAVQIKKPSMHMIRRGQVIKKSTPDANGDNDSTTTDEDNNLAVDFEYRYDARGNMRLLKDPNQRAS